MPDENGKLNAKDKRVLESWIENRKCPSCGATRWDVSTQLATLLPISREGVVMREETSVHHGLSMTCLQCASILMLNARVVGIV